MKTIAVLTTTLYRNASEVRFHLACQCIGNAVALNYNVFVGDGSPDPGVWQAFSAINANVYREEALNMGDSRRELFTHAAASEQDIFLWTEPEKVDLMRWIPAIVAPLVKDDADIVIPARTEESFTSYPAFQAKSEQAANAVYAEEIGRTFDPMFGPIAFTRKALRYFAACKPFERFDVPDGYIQHVAPLEALADGLRISSVLIDFLYPLVQRREEEGPLLTAMNEKRKKQFDALTLTYRKVAKALRLT